MRHRRRGAACFLNSFGTRNLPPDAGWNLFCLDQIVIDDTCRQERDMTPDQVKAIQDSFAKVKPIAGQAATLFYGRLFETAPEVKPLFGGDMTEQGQKLMATLAAVVHGLDKLESILPAASALAKRHVDYGVKAADYAPVGAALLWTLEQGLGEQWTPDLAEAWGEAYKVLSGYMIAEAYRPA
jgi:hemoglobin-like flavoprotein